MSWSGSMGVAGVVSAIVWGLVVGHVLCGAGEKWRCRGGIVVTSWGRSENAFKTGIAGTAKKAPMHSPNSPVAQQQINSPVIPNLLSQPRAEPRTTFRERAPPSSSIHEHRPRPPRPTTATLQPTTTRLPHPHRNPVASEGTQRQTTPQPSHRHPMVHHNPPSAPY